MALIKVKDVKEAIALMMNILEKLAGFFRMCSHPAA
jgi:hypothetical protein